MKKKKNQNIRRDFNILLAAQGRINLSTSSPVSKKIYTRKIKHKNNY